MFNTYQGGQQKSAAPRERSSPVPTVTHPPPARPQDRTWGLDGGSAPGGAVSRGPRGRGSSGVSSAAPRGEAGRG